jgi:hypothetical protein
MNKKFFECSKMEYKRRKIRALKLIREGKTTVRERRRSRKVVIKIWQSSNSRERKLIKL